VRQPRAAGGTRTANDAGMIPVEPNSCLTIAMAPDANRPTCCRVVLGEADGWDIRLDVGDDVISITHCEDWHRVERICSEIYGLRMDTHTEPSARR
jgi:hypothetical protein